ncbi:uncharacterized protein LOC131995848 [Stomoxys calcitrans]|uniref:uncharacterized protein LOC131995848 n=1 Tax=Stomoxys calcitrans TaxID=35570 RepID=UPI0027E3B071|nr:uncharacterized protein LOC131995848 [Stomoxys calcitrans]
MIRILKNQKSGLTIVHINAQSLNNKLDELDDRHSHAGGVAIYLKNCIHGTIKLKSEQSNCIEYLFVEITGISNSSMLIGCVYRPNSSTPFDMLISCLERISLRYNDIVIAGDFNSNILIETQFSDAMELLDLVPTNRSVPTHFTNHSSTLLDIFFVNCESKVLLYDQIAAPAFSKHDLIFLVYDYHINQQDEAITFRDFKKLNYNLLNSLTDNVEWDSIYQLNSVDDQTAFLQHYISLIYSQCVPEKTITIKNQQPPWFNEQLRALIDERNIAYKRWKRYRTTQLHERFKCARRNVGKSINEAKTLFFLKKFLNAVNSRSKWKEIRKIGIGAKTNTNFPPNLNINELNEHFVSVCSICPHENIYENMNTVQVENPFSFCCVDQTDVLNSILSIKSDATGTDGINPRFIKIIMPKLLPYVTYIFNTVLTKSTFPHEWKLAKIIPTRKSNNEYRPIAILPFLSKALMHNGESNRTIPVHSKSIIRMAIWF